MTRFLLISRHSEMWHKETQQRVIWQSRAITNLSVQSGCYSKPAVISMSEIRTAQPAFRTSSCDPPQLQIFSKQWIKYGPNGIKNKWMMKQTNTYKNVTVAMMWRCAHTQKCNTRTVRVKSYSSLDRLFAKCFAEACDIALCGRRFHDNTAISE